jgi:hypothetical protein
VNAARRSDDLANFAWQSEYGVLSFSEKALTNVVAYVCHQPERHAEHRTWPGLERASEEISGIGAKI